jgi:hypothetical protein
MTQDFESFNEEDDEWLSELETRAIDLEQELFDWRELRSRELSESDYRREAKPGQGAAAFRRSAREGTPPPDGATSVMRAAPRPARRPTPPVPSGRHAPPGPPAPRESQDVPVSRDRRVKPDLPDRSGASPRAYSAEERTRVLIDQGRRSVERVRMSRGRKITLVTAAALAVVTALVLVVFRAGASWPPSVATVQSEITTACQNPNVASEPGQVNFACGQATSQILWIFALMTSNDTPSYNDAKTGREGLEPITVTQGGEVAWSLDLHHPYNPYDPIDSLEVAARAINNIIGGATLTSAKGSPAVQPGLESSPANCARYTGSSAVISRAGFPNTCAQPVTSPAGQAALVADVYRDWVVGATATAAQNVSVLFQNARNPGNPQVQAILKTLPGAH